MKILTDNETRVMQERKQRRERIRRMEVTPQFREQVIAHDTWFHGYKPANHAYLQGGVSPAFEAGEERIRVMRENALDRGTRLESLFDLEQPLPWHQRLAALWRLHRTTAALSIVAPAMLFVIIVYIKGR